MKNFLWMVSGICAAAAGFLVWGTIRTESLTSTSAPAPAPAPVEDLAHRLEDAWADHHTVA